MLHAAAKVYPVDGHIKFQQHECLAPLVACYVPLGKLIFLNEGLVLMGSQESYWFIWRR